VAVEHASLRSDAGSRFRRSRIGVWFWELGYRIGPNLWVIPMCTAAVAVGIYAVTRRLDRLVVEPDGIRVVPEFLVARSPADAALVLSALLAALATALTLVFSTSVLTFSLATSQLGPRLIRRFIEDPVTQLALGILLSGVILCTLTLASVRTGAGAAGVPEVSYAVTVLVALACFFVIVVYVHRVATSIQAPRVVAAVVADLDRTVTELDLEYRRLGRSDDAAAVERRVAEVESDGIDLLAHGDGFVQVMDLDRLLAVAERGRFTLVMRRRPGRFVVRGLAIARVSPPDAFDAARRVIDQAVEIGDSRTRRQDLEFALYQVVEIGLRALSPAINDTFTGMTCVDWLTAALCRLGQQVPDTGGMLGRDGEIRLVERPVPFSRQIKAAYDMLRQAGAANPAVIIRMLDDLATLARHVDAAHLDDVDAQAEAVLASGLARHPVAADADEIRRRYRTVAGVIAARRDGGDPTTGPGTVTG
jgi:uncharacterized membrane protein